jgi:hypothetical protein
MIGNKKPEGQALLNALCSVYFLIFSFNPALPFTGSTSHLAI